MLRLILVIAVFSITQFPVVSHAQTAHLQSNRIFVDDIAELIIEFDNKIPSLYALDTSVLEADFEVLDVKPSISRIFESDEAFHRMRWRIDILPLRTGILEVPSLQVGESLTPALGLEVIPQSPEFNSAANVRVELEAEPENPYVGQQVKITIRVIHNVPLFEGSLVEPDVGSSDTYRPGLESRYTIFQNDTELGVLERNLSIIILEPGETRIPPASYRGRIRTGTDLATTETGALSRRINRASAARYLEVRRPPAEFSGRHWLPARQLTLGLQWDQVNDNLSVGDSLGLTLSIEAHGLAAEMLPPNLLSMDTDSFKIYNDQETRSNRFDGQELIGRLEQRFVIIVTEPGEIHFPALVLKWWDVDRESEQVATIDGRNWIVSGPATGQANHGVNTVSPGLDDRLARGLVFASIPGGWPWYAGIGTSLLIIGLLVYIKPVRHYLLGQVKYNLDRLRNRSALKQACRTNNPTLTRRALIKWGRARWPLDNINGLHQIESRINSTGLARELRQLSTALYSDRSPGWQGRQLWQLLTDEERNLPGVRQARERSLPALYPRRS
ncbi:MAG: hypothetical protein OES20_08750 [Gammaproteobacteria bacterium]|nr:hypothetical protein [Gammaproteobacteria bacterium]MDH3857897.1 hypothetical protein [Gammaproteobacteria bacterium]